MIQTSNMSDAWMPNAFEILLMGGATPTTFTLAKDSTTGAYPTIIPGMLMVFNSDGTVSPAVASSSVYLGFAYQYCNYNGFSQVDESGSITVVIPGAASIFKFSGPILGSSLPTINSELSFDPSTGLIENQGTSTQSGEILGANARVIDVEEGSVTVLTGVNTRAINMVASAGTSGSAAVAVSKSTKSSAAKSA